MPQFEDSRLSYLTRRDGRYQYRRRFPREVAEIVGRTEFRKALGTSSRAEALRLARRVSVEFDTVCEEALAQAQGAAEAAASPEQAQEAYRETAQAVLASLDDVVHSMTRNAVDTMTTRPDWRQELHAQRRFLEAQARGEVGHPLRMHPLHAKAAVRALGGVLDGEPVKTEGTLGTPEKALRSGVTPAADASRTQADMKTGADGAAALEAYAARVSMSREATARKIFAEAMQWPSTLTDQLQRLVAHGESRLAGGTAPNSVHTQVSAGIGVLREIPGWEGAELPLGSGLARSLKGKVGPRRDATKPVPLELLRGLVQKMKAPEDRAALVLLARYGLRPGELLQEGTEALGTRTDVLGNSETVFHAGLSGGKTDSARRDLPVHPDDVSLFRTVLRGLKLPAQCTGRERSARATSRGKRLYRMVLRHLGAGYKLYGIRHLVADLLRAAGATYDETGEVLGHAVQAHRVTSIYGGAQPLTRTRELLGRVREYSAGW